MADVSTVVKMLETTCEIIYEMIEKLNAKEMAEYYAIRNNLETVKLYVYKEGFIARFDGKNNSTFTVLAKDNNGRLEITKSHGDTLHRIYTTECTMEQFEAIRSIIERKEQEEMWEKFEDDSLLEDDTEVHGWFLDRAGERIYC